MLGGFGTRQHKNWNVAGKQRDPTVSLDGWAGFRKTWLFFKQASQFLPHRNISVLKYLTYYLKVSWGWNAIHTPLLTHSSVCNRSGLKDSGRGEQQLWQVHSYCWQRSFYVFLIYASDKRAKAARGFETLLLVQAPEECPLLLGVRWKNSVEAACTDDLNLWAAIAVSSFNWKSCHKNQALPPCKEMCSKRRGWLLLHRY